MQPTPPAIQLVQLQRLPPRVARWSPEIWCAAFLYQLDPIALAAIVERESHGGETLKPPGPGGVGDNGHGRGLMQIDDRWHAAFVATGLWSQPVFSVLYGAKLLREALDAFGNDYTVAFGAYNAGIGRVREVIAQLPSNATMAERIAAIDQVTTDAYATGVAQLRAMFARAIGPPAVPQS